MSDSPNMTVPPVGSRELDHLLTELYNACDPNEPAPKEYYADLSGARGNTALAVQVMNRLKRNAPGSFLRFLFSGHIGGGKSSELLHLVELLNADTNPVNGRRFFPIYIDTEEYLNSDDVALPDLLLAIAAEIGNALQKSPMKIQIADTYFGDLLRRIGETMTTKYNVQSFDFQSQLPLGLGSLKATIAPLKRSDSARAEVRNALVTQVDTLRGEVNRILATALLKLKEYEYRVGETPYTDIILIVDSLDRVRRFGGETEVQKAVYELFVRNAPTLRGLDVHVTYTLPLRALYKYAGQLQDEYGIAPSTMPMVAVEKRREPGVPYEKGRDCLRAMLAQRLSGYALDAVFTLAAQDWLLDMSGGHVRNLMIFAQSAFSITESLPIELPVAREAVSPTLQMYSRSVPASYWEKMAALYRNDLRTLDTNDDDYRTMLEQLMVLEYRNGDDETDALSESWYAVNPLVRLLSGFKAALANPTASS